MTFWIIITVLALIVALMLAMPLLRGSDTTQAENPDVALYRDQLAEVDRDLARGILVAEDADRTRTEISRRLLASDAAGTAALATSPKPRARRLAGIVIAALIAGPMALYYGTDRALVAAGMDPADVAAWQDTLSLSYDLDIGAQEWNFWIGPIFAGLGAPGYPDIPMASRIAASEQARETRISQLEAEQLVAQMGAPRPTLPPAQAELLDGLNSIVQTDPADLETWARIATLAAEGQMFDTAARAQTQFLTLQGTATDTDDHVRLAILLILAADGYVSPEAEAQLQLILTRDPRNIAARYYYGLLFFETDRPDRAFALFRDVINEGRDENPFVKMARGLVEEAAFRAGVDYQLPPLRGPSMADIAAATDMTDDQREQMIAGMVDSLSTRLANQGGPVSDWAMLINALVQIGDIDQANTILVEAFDLFATSPEAMEILTNTANIAGLME